MMGFAIRSVLVPQPTEAPSALHGQFIPLTQGAFQCVRPPVFIPILTGFVFIEPFGMVSGRLEILSPLVSLGPSELPF
jgi:hypothetical protein